MSFLVMQYSVNKTIDMTAAIIARTVSPICFAISLHEKRMNTATMIAVALSGFSSAKRKMSCFTSSYLAERRPRTIVAALNKTALYYPYGFPSSEIEDTLL